MELQSGEWEGEYRDVNGFFGDISMRIGSDDEEFTGVFELTLFKPAMTDDDEPRSIDGRIHGDVREDKVAFEVTPVEKSEEPLRYTGTMRDAGSYAKQALFGSVDPIAATNFGGGVWIAWLFGRGGE